MLQVVSLEAWRQSISADGDAHRGRPRPFVFFKAATEQDIGAAFANIAQRQFDALVVQPEPLFNDRRAQIVELASNRSASIWSST
jgi:hypothetical protein